MRWCLFSLNNPNKLHLTLSAHAEFPLARFNLEETRDQCNTCFQQQFQVSIATSWAKELDQVSHNNLRLSKILLNKFQVIKNFFIKRVIQSPVNTVIENKQIITTKTLISHLLLSVEVAMKALNKNHSSSEVAKQQVSRSQQEQSQHKGM